jgi:hypothetical protein
VLQEYIAQFLPDVHAHFQVGVAVDWRWFRRDWSLPLMFVAVLRQSLGIGLSLIAGPWFLCIFVNTLPWASVFRVWDVFLLEGIRVLFRVTIAIIILNKTAIMQACRAAFFFDASSFTTLLPLPLAPKLARFATIAYSTQSRHRIMHQCTA